MGVYRSSEAKNDGSMGDPLVRFVRTPDGDKAAHDAWLADIHERTISGELKPDEARELFRARSEAAAGRLAIATAEEFSPLHQMADVQAS